MHQSSCWCAFPVVRSHFSRPYCALHGSGGACLSTGDPSGLRGSSSQALILFRGVRLFAWRLRRPFLRGMLTGHKIFLGLPDASGQQPWDWIHLKNGLVPHTYAWWSVCQIPVHQSASWCTSPVVGSHFSRPCYVLHGSGWVCLITGDSSGLGGGVPLGFNPLRRG